MSSGLVAGERQSVTSIVGGIVKNVAVREPDRVDKRGTGNEQNGSQSAGVDANAR